MRFNRTRRTRRGRRMYESNRNIGATILKQLGSNKFITMTGAKNFRVDEHGSLTFNIGSGAKKGINTVRIILTPRDTYDVEFYKIRGVNVKLITTITNVYASELRSVFTNTTGFYTSL